MLVNAPDESANSCFVNIDAEPTDPMDRNEPTEPIDPESPLFRRDGVVRENVVATPHVAGATTDSLRVMALLAADEVLAVLRGDRARNVVNPAVYD